MNVLAVKLIYIFSILQKEMENYKEDEAKDYWLIQFQRLLDSKPSVLVDEVGNPLKYYIMLFSSSFSFSFSL